MTRFAGARLLGMTALNTYGILFFLATASHYWIEPELADVPGASGGDAVAWGVTALPIMVGFFLIDLLWLIGECVAYLTKRIWRFPLSFLVIPVVIVPIAWVIAAYVDNSHHGM